MSEFIEPTRPSGPVTKLGNISRIIEGIGGELWIAGNGIFYRVTTVYGDRGDWRAWGRLSPSDAKRCLEALSG